MNKINLLDNAKYLFNNMVYLKERNIHDICNDYKKNKHFWNSPYTRNGEKKEIIKMFNELYNFPLKQEVISEIINKYDVEFNKDELDKLIKEYDERNSNFKE